MSDCYVNICGYTVYCPEFEGDLWGEMYPAVEL